MLLSLAPTLRPMIERLRLRADLSLADADAVLALPHRRTFLDHGTYIVREGDHVDRCCVMLAGFVYRHKVVGSGARQILSVHLRGDIIGLQSSLLEQADHNVQALTRIEVAFIPRQAILDLCGRYPMVARAIWADTLVDASLFREWIANVGRRTARQRIAHLFCELALRQEAAGLCEGPDYSWPMTQEQIGDATGLTSVHVNRVLQGLRAEGLIRTAKQRVTILDWDNLQEAADFNCAYLHLPEADSRCARRPSSSELATAGSC